MPDSVMSPKIFELPQRRNQLSLFSPGEILLSIQNGQGVAVDPDEGSLSISIEMNDGTVTNPIISNENEGIVKEEQGLYRFNIPSSYLTDPAEFDVTWNYTFNGTENVFKDYYVAFQYSPTWLSFSREERALVNRIMFVFLDDLFDNVEGGVPAFAEEYQTRFGIEKVAGLMEVALDTINVSQQPLTNFVIGPRMGKRFPSVWYGLLLKATYIEILKHFVRTYVEQPNITGGNVVRSDRRDYMQRWQAVLDGEKADLKGMLSMFKKEQLGLGEPSIIVAGGMYGYGARSVSTYGTAARAGRFYPVSFVMTV